MVTRESYYKAMGLADYLDDARISNSGMELWREDHVIFVDRVIDRKPWPHPTDVMKFGNYFEDLLFCPRNIKARYAVAKGRPDDPLKVIHRGSAEYKKFARESAGKTIILPGQAARATAMLEAVFSHPAAARLVKQGIGTDQVVIHWRCPHSGLLMKGRPDRVIQLDGPWDVIMDLKTDRDPRDTHEKERRWHEAGYHRKLAGYIDGWYEATGRNAVGYIVAASNTGPVRCCTYTYEADRPAISTGREEYIATALQIAAAIEAGEFRYPEEIEAVEATVPAWSAIQAAELLAKRDDEHA